MVDIAIHGGVLAIGGHGRLGGEDLWAIHEPLTLRHPLVSADGDAPLVAHAPKRGKVDPLIIDLKDPQARQDAVLFERGPELR